MIHIFVFDLETICTYPLIYHKRAFINMPICYDLNLTRNPPSHYELIVSSPINKG